MARASRRVRAAVVAGAPCTYPTTTTTEDPPGGGSGPGAPDGASGGVIFTEDQIWYEGFEFPMSPLQWPTNGAVEIRFRSPLDDGTSGGRDHTSPPSGDPFTFDKKNNGFDATNPWAFGIYENLTGNDLAEFADYTEPPSEI